MTEDSILRKLRRYAPLIGDDCAIIRPKPNEDLLFTTDFTIENVHFTRESRPEAIGHRALARSLSDIAAMGGRPRHCLVSLALAPWTDSRWIDSFYRGLLKLARSTATELAGGDISHSSQFACDVMVCGSVARGRALRRSGAKPGDIVYVSGPLGGWTHKPVIVPRLKFGQKLAGKAHSCMDISDGLALDLHRLCMESGVAADIVSIPLLAGATLEQALYDGEDYELLYTGSAAKRLPGVAIGTIREGRPGALTLSGKRLTPKGYDHTQHRS